MLFSFSSRFIDFTRYGYVIILMSSLNFLVDYNPIAYAFNKLFSHSPILSSIPEYLSDTLISRPQKNVERLLFTAGVVAITYKVVKKLYTQIQRWKWVPAHLQNNKQLSANKLKKVYGNCFVVITGCTQGIGLAYAIEFARFGFGLVLVARNKEKLERRIMEIKSLCPDVECHKVIGDLSKIQDIKRVSSELIDLSTKIDIGIVVNNAGYAGQSFSSFIKKEAKQLISIMNINFTSSYHFNSVLLPILRQRKERSAILNVASCAGVFISQGNGTYTTSKVLLDIYSRTMALQNRDKVDVLSVRPFGVKTPMMSMKKGNFMISPKQCVLTSLADLGTTDATWTGFMHKVQASYFQDFNEEARFQIFSKLFQFKNK